MKLCYFHSINGNFGDDLNPWLWPKLFGYEAFNKIDDVLFIGIGSILSNGWGRKIKSQFKTSTQKVVFGSGIRNENDDFSFMDNWDVYFVRGPISSKRIFNDYLHFISDPAYCIRLLDNYKNVNNRFEKNTKFLLCLITRVWKYFPGKVSALSLDTI